jgi:hypothetical protein
MTPTPFQTYFSTDWSRFNDWPTPSQGPALRNRIRALFKERRRLRKMRYSFVRLLAERLTNNAEEDAIFYNTMTDTPIAFDWKKNFPFYLRQARDSWLYSIDEFQRLWRAAFERNTI